MKRLLIILATALSLSCLASAQETPLWLRKNAISPDGKQISFEYKGDIFVVSSEGGRATQITSNEAYESNPVWTKDSKSVVFSSSREDSDDIYIVPAQGGVPKRLTTYTSGETPLAVLDGYKVLFTSRYHLI